MLFVTNFSFAFTELIFKILSLKKSFTELIFKISVVDGSVSRYKAYATCVNVVCY